MKRNIARLVLCIAAIVTSLAVSWLRTSSVSAAGLEKLLSNLPIEMGYRGETLKGELEVIAECDDTTGRTLYFLKTERERIPLKFAKAPDNEFRTGMQVSAKGTRKDGDFVAAEIQNESLSPEALPNTIGERKLLVLLVNFSDNATQPFTAAQANSLIFDAANTSSVTNFYRENSYGQTWITGDTFGWATLPIKSGDCGGTQIASYAKQAATNAGVNLSAYNNYMYIFPTMSQCSYGGTSTIGGNQTWINGYLNLGTIAHELGHNFGLYHARALDCGTVSLGSNCSSIEYGSNVDTMGKPGVTGHFQAFNKERLGWLNAPGLPTTQTVQYAGNYTISPDSATDPGPKALKILKSVDASGIRTWYYIELRRPLGFDKFVSSNVNLMNGVVVSQIRETSGQENFLLDMTPETDSWNDPALTVGRTFSDPGSGLTITPISVDDGGAVINVSISGSGPACVAAAPSLNLLSPSTQTTGPGGSVTYSLSVRNNNNNGCLDNNFDIRTALPVGWTSAAQPASFSINPGSSASFDVTVTAPTGTPDGPYAGTITVAGTNNSTTANVSIVVSTSSALAVSVVPKQAEYSLSQTAVVVAGVSAKGSPAGGASVIFTMTKPDGTSIKGTALADASGNALFNYRFNRKKDSPGQYMVSAQATQNALAGSGTATFLVR